jgi:DNA-binding NtrC family response regulator
MLKQANSEPIRSNFVANFGGGDDLSQKNQILVVEDDPLISEVIAAALDDIYPTIVVGTAADALGELQRGNVRLMLLDCTLPGGVDVTLLPEADRAGSAVILMSGDPGRMAMLTDQPRPFVLKPFTLTGLLKMVETVLAESAPAVG